MWCVAFGLEALAITVCNTLAILVFSKRKFLRKRARYFLISLAVADLVVATVSIPLYISVLGGHYDFWIVHFASLATVYRATDILAGFASMFSLAIISLERLYAIAAPLLHRTLATRLYFYLICLSWTLASSISSVSLMYSFEILPKGDFYGVIVVSLSATLLVTIAAYVGTWIKARFRNQTIQLNNCKEIQQERKLLMTVFIITSVFLITWLPFHVINAVNYYCQNTCGRIPFSVILFAKLLHYGNSFANAIIYVFKVPEFRKGLKMLCYSKKKQRAIYKQSQKDTQVFITEKKGSRL